LKICVIGNEKPNEAIPVRGICYLAPGVKGMSESIKVKRTIDRYLEHGRIFIFHNNSNPIVYMGSADWMIRNIYRRIEVCFPIYQADVKAELIKMISMQVKDNVQSVWVDQDGNDQLPGVIKGKKAFRSQMELGRFLLLKSTAK
jgi:polyphosphate kinase